MPAKSTIQGRVGPDGKMTYEFEARVWLYDGPAAWYFISLPQTISDEVSELFADQKRGWGSLPVIVRIGISTWQTSIFPESKSGCYFLPIKAAIRKQAGITVDDLVQVNLQINV